MHIPFLVNILQPIFGVIACSVLASPKRIDDPPRSTSATRFKRKTQVSRVRTQPLGPRYATPRLIPACSPQ